MSNTMFIKIIQLYILFNSDLKILFYNDTTQMILKILY